MIKRLLILPLFSALLCTTGTTTLKGQCPLGWTQAQTNWDWLDYLINAGNYVPTANYPGVPAAKAANQAFAIGTNRFTIAYAGGVACTLGENATNTAEAGSNGAGVDVQYANNGTVTITFDTLVKNVRFSLYDIDINQAAQVTATDGALGLAVTMNVVTAGTILVLGSPGLTPVATSNATAVANNNTQATLNISIGGGLTGVKQVVITIGGIAGDWWLSDISACVYKVFSTNYFLGARPFTGQATYILSTPDSNSVAYIDTATGRARFLFSGNLTADANSPDYVNGLAYDYKNHYLYYVHDFGTNAYNTRTLRMWDYNTESISSLAVDVNTLGIPTFDFGVESAGAAFYDGSLYLGIEAGNSGRNSGRETSVWRIDFNSSGTPIQSCMVFAVPADNGGGTGLHDWNDFVIKDGILYDFDGVSTTQDDYYHFNMQTGVMLQDYTTALTINRPRQTGITWAGSIYWVYDSIGVYNGAGAVGTKRKIIGNSPNYFPDWAKGPSGIGPSGDATGPFKPKTDFGDAPATYDPASGDPATHERDTTLRLGSAYDREWAAMPSVLADGDGADEDGITPYVPIFSPGAANYLAAVNVYNNTGANATLIAWLDYNGNGVFDAAEACNTVTVVSGTSTQTLFLYWPFAPTTLPNGSYTYLRIRVTSAANGMTAANPTGYYSSGEVEDYRVLVDDFPLSASLLSFDAQLENNSRVKLVWQASETAELLAYETERSRNSRNWEALNLIPANGQGVATNYESWDNQPLIGISYYRLKMTGSGGVKYSDIRTVNINTSATYVTVSPNPAQNTARVNLQRSTAEKVTVKVMNLQGAQLFTTTAIVNGTASVEIPVHQWQAGTYIVQVITGNELVVQKLVIIK